MSLPEAWTATAFNPVPESENRIHGDDVAQQYGFRGGLVPGVVVSAYLLHPAALAWGRDWAERGQAHAVVRSPLYDGEEFRVEVAEATDTTCETRLLDARGEPCASASASLPDAAALPPPPRRRGDALLPRGFARPRASRETLERLRETGMGALPARWDQKSEITSYLRDRSGMAPVFRDAGLAHAGFVLGLSNWVFAGNVKMEAWLHLETHSQHYRAVEPGAALVVEAAIADLFDKKGHEFADVDVAVYASDDDAALARIRLRAIYRLRAAARC